MKEQTLTALAEYMGKDLQENVAQLEVQVIYQGASWEDGCRANACWMLKEGDGNTHNL